MVLKFLENSLNLCIFTHAPFPHSKIHLEFFENLFPTANSELLYLNSIRKYQDDLQH